MQASEVVNPRLFLTSLLGAILTVLPRQRVYMRMLGIYSNTCLKCDAIFGID